MVPHSRSLTAMVFIVMQWKTIEKKNKQIRHHMVEYYSDASEEAADLLTWKGLWINKDAEIALVGDEHKHV